MAGITWGNNVLSTTQDFHIAKAVDTTLRGNVFATKMLLNAKPWRGEKMKKTVKVLNLSNGKSFSGLETFDTAQTDTFRLMEFTPAEYGQPITLAYDEITINSGEEQVIDLLALKTEEAGIEMANAIGTIFYGNGTGKDFNGLGNLIDDGTVASTIGGLSRSTYSTLNSTVTVSNGTLTLDKMATQYDATSYGMDQPTEIVMDKTLFSLYERLLTPQERIMKTNTFSYKGGTSKAGTGYTYDAFTYRGKPIMVDEKATSGVIFMINDRYIDFYSKNFYKGTPVKFNAGELEGTDYNSVKGYGFSWTGWREAFNAEGMTGRIILFGNLIVANCNRHSKATSYTTV